MAVWSVVRFSELEHALRLDPEYYRPRYMADAKRLDAVNPHRIADFAVVTDGIHTSPDVVEDDGVQYLSAKCVKDNAFSLGNTLTISRAQHAANPRTALKEGDVLVTTVGTIGNAAVVQKELLPANSDRHLGIIRLISSSEISPYYLATFLNSEYGRFQSLRMSTGNVQLNLFIEKIREIRVPLLAEAETIAQTTQEAYRTRRKSKELIAAAEALLMEALGLDRLDLSPSKTYTRRFRDLRDGRRFGAEYYMPAKKRVLDALGKLPHRTVEDHAPDVRTMWDPKRAPKGEMVRNFDLTDALEPFIGDSVEPQAAGEIGSTKKCFRNGDVIVSRLRSYLKELAIVRTSDKPRSVGSSEFIVLRPKTGRLSAETLMVYLRCPLVQTVLKWSQDGSNHPRFSETDLLAIPVPDKLLAVQKKIDAFVNESLTARREAAELLEQAKRRVESLIAGKDEEGL